jgi:hypothetical protein
MKETGKEPVVIYIYIYIYKNWFFAFLRIVVMNLKNHPDNLGVCSGF